MNEATDEPFVDASEIAIMLGRSRDLVYTWTRNGAIPAHTLEDAQGNKSRAYFYLKSEVREALKPAKRGSWVQSNRSRARKRVTSTNTRMDLAS